MSSGVSLHRPPAASGQAAPAGEELIRLHQVQKTYFLGEVPVPVLRGVDLTIHRGEFVALMGASGSGKTTLMNLLGCLDRPTAGEYRFAGQDIGRLPSDGRAELRNQQIGFVFQNFNLLPRTTAVDNAAMPLSYAPRPCSEREGRRRAVELLCRVGLAERLDHEPSKMSGGQQQRVAIARALINRPALILADEPTGNLDSHSSADVLRMLKQLHAEGITIVLVTHDLNVARAAQRIVWMRDGRIVRDERPEVSDAEPDEPAETQSASSMAAPSPPPPAPRPRWFGGRIMPRSLRTALKAIRRNQLNSALTALGIVIGIAAVIAMMEIGEGSRDAVQRTISKMGANNMLVQPGAASSGGVTFGSGSRLTLTPQDAMAIAQQCPAVVQTAPIVRVRAQVVAGNRNWVPFYLYGTTPEYLQIRDWEELAAGVMFDEHDVRAANQVCVLGQTVVRELFDGRTPLGEEISVNNVAFRVVGVLTRKGANMVGLDEDDVVLAPWTTIKFRVSGQNFAEAQLSEQAAAADPTAAQTLGRQRYPGATPLYPPAIAQPADRPQPMRMVNVDRIMVQAASAVEIPAAIEQITALLRQRHRLRPGQADDFNIRDMTALQKSLASTSNLMSGLLLSVALISLVVGGVGIMNIMLVSVTERTREIGLRMAVGAKSRQILRQFLLESVVLCLLGGGAGITLGRSVSWGVTAVLGWPTKPSVAAVVASALVAVGVGIVFGWYPAWKASRLDPIEALRYE